VQQVLLPEPLVAVADRAFAPVVATADGNRPCNLLGRRWTAAAAAAAAALGAATAAALVLAATAGWPHAIGAGGTAAQWQLVDLAEATPHVGHLQNHLTGMCLDWGNIILNILPCNPRRPEQVFSYTALGQRLTSREHQPRCVDSGGKYVHIWACGNGHHGPRPQKQHWTINSESGLISQAFGEEELCLEATRNTVGLRPCDAERPMQHWRFAQSLQRPQRVAKSSRTSSVSRTTSGAPRTTRSRTTTMRTTTSAPRTTATTASQNATTTASRTNTTTASRTDTTTAMRTTATTVTRTTTGAALYEVVKVRHFPNICLTVNKNGSLHMEICDSSSRRQCWWHSLDSGKLQSFNKQCLDSDEENLLGQCEDSSTSQAWGILKDSGSIMTQDGRCLEARWSNKNGSAVTLHKCKGNSVSQAWYVEAHDSPQ